MNQQQILFIILIGSLTLGVIHADTNDMATLKNRQLEKSFLAPIGFNIRKETSERSFLPQSVEAAEAEASLIRAGSSLELRPEITDDDYGAGLRWYLPTLSKHALKDRLMLAAEQEKLRIDALEWRDVISTYELLSQYRYLKAKEALFAKKASKIEDLIQKVDEAVKKKQLTRTDRAKFYGDYLDIINASNDLQYDLNELIIEIQAILGVHINIEAMAQRALITIPDQITLDNLIDEAMRSRVDYKQLQVTAEALAQEKKLLKKKSGIRLKFLQASINNDFDNNTSGRLSASIHLWDDTPDKFSLSKKENLVHAQLDYQRNVIKNELENTFQSYNRTKRLNAEQRLLTDIIVAQLTSDLKTLRNQPLAQQRDVLALEKELLDAELQKTRNTYLIEKRAIALARSLGSIRF